MSRLIRASAVPAAVALLAALAFASTSGASPVAQASRYCGYSTHLGFSYVKLYTSGTNCTTGRRVVRAYRHCRGGGLVGHCHHRVLGYRCRPHVIDHSPYQFDAHVRCDRGRRHVAFTLTQNR